MRHYLSILTALLLSTTLVASHPHGPIPPPAPKLTGLGLNRSVKLTWDKSAEAAVDPAVPDSLGKPFKGYRLLRSVSLDSPFVEIGKWTTDSLLPHEYLDKGTDIGTLKNNIRYHYRLLSFDAGAPSIGLQPMESDIVDGVNAISVVPTTEPTNAISNSVSAVVDNGYLGMISVPILVPTNTTNYNRLFSNKKLYVSIGASTDNMTYFFPVRIVDSVAGRVHNAVIDPKLYVHGKSSIAGKKSGSASVPDVFGLGGAKLEFEFSCEQLADSFIVTPTIESSTGADAPLIVYDSLAVTGITTYSPYTSAQREVIVKFLPGGIDSMSVFLNQIFPYLELEFVDALTNLPVSDSVSVTIRGVNVKNNRAVNFAKNRYYLESTMPNGDPWEFGHLISIYNSKIAIDYSDRGTGSGKQGILFSWGSKHRRGTKEFQAGDKIHLRWTGGIKADFPKDLKMTVSGAPGSREATTEKMLDEIRIVPNPFFVHHEAMRGVQVIYFNYLPEVCSIRIYNMALNLIKVIEHTSGSREEWDLRNDSGKIVASQMLYAYIDAPGGKSVVKKFSIVVGK